MVCSALERKDPGEFSEASDQLKVSTEVGLETIPRTLSPVQFHRYGGKTRILADGRQVHLVKVDQGQWVNLFQYRLSEGRFLFVDSSAIPTWLGYAPVRFVQPGTLRGVDLRTETIGDEGTGTAQLIESGLALDGNRLMRRYSITTSHYSIGMGDGFRFECRRTSTAPTRLAYACTYERERDGKTAARMKGRVVLDWGERPVAKDTVHESCFDRVLRTRVASTEYVPLRSIPDSVRIWGGEPLDSCLATSVGTPRRGVPTEVGRSTVGNAFQ